MKVAIEKRLEAGKYSVRINISDYTNEEVEKIKKFGPPIISIAPQSIYIRSRGAVKQLPLHDMNYGFEFESEDQAISFAETMTDRIKTAVRTLKDMKDQFSGVNEIEL